MVMSFVDSSEFTKDIGKLDFFADMQDFIDEIGGKIKVEEETGEGEKEPSKLEPPSWWKEPDQTLIVKTDRYNTKVLELILSGIVNRNAILVERLGDKLDETSSIIRSILKNKQTAKYRKACKNTDNEKSGREKTGRYYTSGGGLQGVSGFIRRAVCLPDTYDLDIVNCHPVLLLQYIEKNGYVGSTSLLAKYISNREEVFAKIMREAECDRAAAKSAVLEQIYGGNVKISSRVVTSMGKEFTAIRQFMRLKNPKIKPKIGCYSADGSVASKIIGDIENNILYNAVTWLHSKKITVDCLQFDGCQISSIEGLNLDDLSGYVLNTTGYSVSFTVDKITSDLDLSGIESDVYAWKSIAKPGRFDMSDPCTYSDLAEACREVYEDLDRAAAVLIPIMVKSVAYSVKDKQILYKLNGQTTVCTKPLDEMLPDIQYGNGKEMKFYKFIKQYGGQVTYDRFDIFPASNVFSTWIPFNCLTSKVTPAERPALQPFLNHILEDTCANDMAAYRHLMGMIRKIITNPGEPSGVITYIYGPEGSGKSTICDMLRALAGGHNYAAYDNLEELQEKHEAKHEGKPFVIIEETKQENAHCESKLKAIVTRRTINVNQKNINSREVTNVANIFACGNSEPKISRENRRPFVLKSQGLHSMNELGISDEEKNKRFEYFRTIYNGSNQRNVFDESMAQAFYKYLMEEVADNWFCVTGYITAAHKVMREYNLSPFQAFVEYIYEIKDDPEEELGVTDGLISVSSLYSKYIKWAGDTGERPCHTLRTIGRAWCAETKKDRGVIGKVRAVYL